MAPSSTTFVKGKLKLKGGKDHGSKKKAKTNKIKSSSKDSSTSKGSEAEASRELDSASTEPFDGMTEAERRAQKFKLERQLKDISDISRLSHRDRVEQFNEKLSMLTELNDIPRVSAAGNG
mmetsp:Transcript_19146/g.27239  ORF Transcript_19146/g.27239 Transcript_19146/m.27239 type:complete len:121 (+) Transcript_19146:53-415(+)